MQLNYAIVGLLLTCYACCCNRGNKPERCQIAETGLTRNPSLRATQAWGTRGMETCPYAFVSSPTLRTSVYSTPGRRCRPLRSARLARQRRPPASARPPRAARGPPAAPPPSSTCIRGSACCQAVCSCDAHVTPLLCTNDRRFCGHRRQSETPGDINTNISVHS